MAITLCMYHVINESLKWLNSAIYWDRIVTTRRLERVSKAHKVRLASVLEQI